MRGLDLGPGLFSFSGCLLEWCCARCCSLFLRFFRGAPAMSGRLPVRRYIKVYVQKRKNKPLPGRERTTSYTLYWREYGERRFMSLGQFATRAYADRMAREKE